MVYQLAAFLPETSELTGQLPYISKTFNQLQNI